MQKKLLFYSKELIRNANTLHSSKGKENKIQKLTTKAKEKLFKWNNKAHWKRKGDVNLSIYSPSHGNHPF